MKRVAVLLTLLALACDSPFEFVAPVTGVRITPDSAALNAGDSVQFSAVATDSEGHTVSGLNFVWTSASESIATVTQSGRVHALRPGRILITAAAQGILGHAPLRVLTDIVAVEIDQGELTLVPGGALQLTASGRDAAGDTLYGRPVTWDSGDTSVIKVSITGMVTARRVADTFLEVYFGGVQQSVQIHVRPVTFYAIVAASEADHTCGLAFPSRVVCWGSSNLGQVGVPAITQSLAPVAATNNPSIDGIVVGGTFTCGLVQISGVYCWGSSARGRLGTGSQQHSTAVPTPVNPALPLYSLAAGWAHACGLEGTLGSAVCWGENPAAGSDTGTINWIPEVVTSDSGFASLTAGVGFTCALTQSGSPFCWGVNDSGQLGTGDNQTTATPSPVSDGLSLAQITAGWSHACGIDFGGAAYCWGANSLGQLGTGDTASSNTPVLVSGGGTFSSIAAGGNRTCAVTPSGQVYCWGDGTPSLTALGGGLSFSFISVGNAHACGMATSARVYCWGKNNAGQLGDGTTTDRSLPTRVLGQN